MLSASAIPTSTAMIPGVIPVDVMGWTTFFLKSFWTTPAPPNRYPGTYGTASSLGAGLCSGTICSMRSSRNTPSEKQGVRPNNRNRHDKSGNTLIGAPAFHLSSKSDIQINRALLLPRTLSALLNITARIFCGNPNPLIRIFI